MDTIYDKLSAASRGGIKAALCIIAGVHGSAPRKAGAKMIVYADGSIFGTIGGGDLEKKVIENALQAIKKNEAKLYRHDLLHQHGMCCGGSVDIYIEPVMPKNRLYIFGAGHTGKALAKYAIDTGFEVVVIDDRAEYLSDLHIVAVNKMHLHYAQALPLLPFDDHTYVAIMTYSHPYDRDILAYCIKKSFAYLGMIGSRRKVEVTKKMFREAGLTTDEELAKVDMPMGINILAEGPEEIAISILARLIEVKNKKMHIAP